MSPHRLSVSALGPEYGYNSDPPTIISGFKKFESLRVGVTLNPKLLLNLLGCIGWVSGLGVKAPLT